MFSSFLSIIGGSCHCEGSVFPPEAISIERGRFAASSGYALLAMTLLDYQILELLALYFFVQRHHTVDQCLRARRATSHIDIHRHNFIHALYQGIVIEHTA